MNNFVSHSQPNPYIGVGLRHPHYEQSLSHNQTEIPIDFVEIHAENFFAEGGITRALLEDVCNKYALSVHGTSLGLGSQLPVPNDILEKFADLVEFTQPRLVSEHLCFNRAAIDKQVVHTGDLLPIAYDNASLLNIVEHIDHVQNKIKRPILIENLSAYLSPQDLSGDVKDTMSEIEFLTEMCRRAGCGLLLDLNNLIVNALNQNVENPLQSIQSALTPLPADLIGEIHLAGFTDKKVEGFIVDDHGAAVSQQCWDLYEYIVSSFGNKPTLIEWDNNLPEWSVLVAQASTARHIAAS
ncbi:DUF692 domain-containing protein [Agaribacter flavus]|uniref:DUF692 family multinuclear iron-containing protein n=1 Tax=Agaribacter flavus TaxID=1902781 RepID=A0ABV7FQY0_9ALTE